MKNLLTNEREEKVNPATCDVRYCFSCVNRNRKDHTGREKIR